MPELTTSHFVSTLELAALPSAVPCARLHARAIMHEWNVAEMADTVELVVSELVTNAVVASGRAGGQPTYQRRAGLPVLALRLSVHDRQLLVEVWDDVPGAPSRRAAHPTDEHGRGLRLVEALSTRWGYYEPESGRGKVVWAEVAHAPAPNTAGGQGHGHFLP